jgi:type VI secretion system protein ImpA
LQNLLTARNEELPSGENLEYESVFQDLLMAAQPGEEKQAGEEIIAAEPPNAAAVQEKALAVLELSHDLRAAIYLASAEVRINGFEGLAKVTGYIKGCLTDFWDTCHPQLDADDDNDPTMRVNAIIGLTDTTSMLNEIRLAPLTQSNTFGKIGLRGIAISAGEDTAKDGEPQLDAASISAAFQDTDPEALKTIHESAKTALEDVEAINAVFDEQIPGLGPDLSSLIKILKLAVTRLSEEVGVPAAIDEELDAADVVGAAAGIAATPGVITSPKDVEKALGRIIEYYERHEPSSPIPILLLRAQKLVNADFLTIVQELAPGGVDNVNLIGGIVPESSY